MSKVKPFFINSNIHLKKFSYKTVEDILTPLGGNTGNSYITYGLMKAVLGGICDIPHIQNIYTYDFMHVYVILKMKASRSIGEDIK